MPGIAPDVTSRRRAAHPALSGLLRKSLDYLNGLTRDAGEDPALHRALATAYEKFAELQAGTIGAGLGKSYDALETVRKAQRIREMLPDLIGRKTFREAFNEILDAVVRGKAWGREITGLAIQEMGTSAERLPVEAPHELIQPLVELAQARGEIRDDIPPEALARFALRSVLGALRDWGLGSDDTDRETAVQYALTLVFDALRKQP